MCFSKPVTTLIKRRFSCRNYIESPIPDTIRASLVKMMSELGPGPFGNLPRFTLVAATGNDRRALRSLGTYGFINGAPGFIVGALKEGEKNLEDYGYLMEKVILYATGLDLGTCWLGGTFKKSAFAQKISPEPDEYVPAVVSIGMKANTPRKIENLLREGADADRRLPWERLFFDGSFSQSLSPENAGRFTTPLEMVRMGPSASNKQPWRVVKDGQSFHFYLQRTPGYRESLLVRLFTVADMQRLDMGIALCHFEFTAREVGLSGNWIVDPPDLHLPDTLTEYQVTWQR